ncbi:MAG: polymer-forming cytoskeletal protein, partial [Candidatus Zixiibacteriota bacterium]
KVICSDCVTVGATGIVEAEIEANTAIIAGRMVGNVATTEKVELQAKCEMEGDLKTKSLIIEQGAVFCGACNMKDSKPNLGFLSQKDTQPEVEPEKKKTI